ncbi:MAG: hypothetical protein P1V20_17480 [Verrucomicrobiales bacterium]|nr:hypothetical protein [Verrucomicrobiales bacterium]
MTISLVLVVSTTHPEHYIYFPCRPGLAGSESAGGAPLVMARIETHVVVAESAAIAAVDGIGELFVGPSEAKADQCRRARAGHAR